MANEYMTKEFWDKAPEGYDYWIVPSEDLKFEVDSDFHRYEPNWPGSAAYVDAKDLYWLAVNEGLNYTVYKRPKFEEETGKSLGKTEVKLDNDGWYKQDKLPPVGTVCQGLDGCNRWHKCRIVHHSIGKFPKALAATGEDESGIAIFHDFRPLPKEPTMKEKLLDKWKLQGLEFSEDDETATYCIGTVFDFVLKNFDIKEKE